MAACFHSNRKVDCSNHSNCRFFQFLWRNPLHSEKGASLFSKVFHQTTVPHWMLLLTSFSTSGAAAVVVPLRSLGCTLQLPPASKPCKALDLAPVFTTLLGLAFTNFTPVLLPRRGKALQRGAVLGRTSPVDSTYDSPEKPQRIPTWYVSNWYHLIAGFHEGEFFKIMFREVF